MRTEGPSQSQEVELGRAASRAGSVGPYKGDETMPWNVMDPGMSCRLQISSS